MKTVKKQEELVVELMRRLRVGESIEGDRDLEELRKLASHEKVVAIGEVGLGGEVRRLRKNRLSWQRLDELGLEYRFVARYLRGEVPGKEEMECLLTRAIIQYAKRQITWFKRDPAIRWVRRQESALDLVRRFVAHSK